jgi:hypothetical protein
LTTKLERIGVLMRFAILTLTLASLTSVSKGSVVLTFEGLANGTPVGNYYGGGPGGNLGISFSSVAYAYIDSDAGGTSSFANEPSPSTAMTWVFGGPLIMNVAGGFDTGFSFYHTSSSFTQYTVSIYDGLDGTGNLLGSITFGPTGNSTCTGDPTGVFCQWAAVGTTFSGTAQSVHFGNGSFIFFDNVTLDSLTPGPAVPEPSSIALMSLGFALAAWRKRFARLARINPPAK